MVARVAQISRQALYRTPKPRSAPQRRAPADPIEQTIVELAEANQTDGYRMVCAFVRRRLGVAVNRKRVLRVMREQKLIQRRRPLERRKRPGFFRVERPRQLWQLDMSSGRASGWPSTAGATWTRSSTAVPARSSVGASSCAAAPTRRSPSSNARPPCTGSSRAEEQRVAGDRPADLGGADPQIPGEIG
jgi:hypothetical protein